MEDCRLRNKKRRVLGSDEAMARLKLFYLMVERTIQINMIRYWLKVEVYHKITTIALDLRIRQNIRYISPNQQEIDVISREGNDEYSMKGTNTEDGRHSTIDHESISRGRQRWVFNRRYAEGKRCIYRALQTSLRLRNISTFWYTFSRVSNKPTYIVVQLLLCSRNGFFFPHLPPLT